MIVVDGTDAATKAKETMAILLGYASLSEMQTALDNSKTIIDKGYIRTQLLEAFSILVNNLSTSATYPAIVLSKSSNALQMFDSDGAMRLKVSGEVLSPIGTTGDTFTCYDRSGEATIVSGESEGTMTFNNSVLATINPSQANNQVTYPSITISVACSALQMGNIATARCNIYLGTALISTSYYDSTIHGSQEIFNINSMTFSVASNSNTQMTIIVEYTMLVEAGNSGFDLNVDISHGVGGGSITYQNNMIEMAKTGLRVMYATNKYMEASFNPSTSVMTLVMRNGNYGFSVTDSGLKKMINGTNWVAL